MTKGFNPQGVFVTPTTKKQRRGAVSAFRSQNDNSMCERCEHGDHENCIGDETVLEGGYTTCCCNASDENVIYEDDEIIEVEAIA